MDKSGRLKLETVDDLFNILQLKKRRREKKMTIHKKQPEPKALVRPRFSFVSVILYLRNSEETVRGHLSKANIDIFTYLYGNILLFLPC